MFSESLNLFKVKWFHLCMYSFITMVILTLSVFMFINATIAPNAELFRNAFSFLQSDSRLAGLAIENLLLSPNILLNFLLLYFIVLLIGSYLLSGFIIMTKFVIHNTDFTMKNIFKITRRFFKNMFGILFIISVVFGSVLFIIYTVGKYTGAAENNIIMIILIATFALIFIYLSSSFLFAPFICIYDNKGVVDSINSSLKLSEKLNLEIIKIFLVVFLCIAGSNIALVTISFVTLSALMLSVLKTIGYLLVILAFAISLLYIGYSYEFKLSKALKDRLFIQK